MSEPLRLISLGAGVQSTCMVLMAAHGDLTPMPDGAIFADTGAEPRKVYEHLKWLMSANVLPFPVHVVRKGNIRDDTYRALNGEKHGKGRSATAPFFARGKDGRGAPLRRQCTSEYKIEPIERELRKMLGVAKGQRVPKGRMVEMWIGISTDEAYRLRPAAQHCIERRWPLVDSGMSRWDCYNWMDRHDYPVVRPHEATPERPPWPPRSACTFCPYHSDAEWRWMHDNAPEDFADAVAIDAAIRPGFRRVNSKQNTGELWLHRSMLPLSEVDLSTAEERGQGNLFGEECEGMCGL